ncbi:PRP38 family-domain-containing protein [Lactarius vividus]|nr:PRP38 family-domain-containing protein [Lactarius vividus]
MANTTVRGAQAIHGQNPQFLVETVIRNRIYESAYWKEHCFALTAESLIDPAIKLRSIGGILLEYLQADEFKYLRALAAVYIRMTFRAVDVYEILEPLLKDYRKLRYRDQSGYYLTYMDEFVDQLLNEERVCDLILPRISKRAVLEENSELAPRQSRLLAAMEGKDEEKTRGRRRSTSRDGSHSSRSARTSRSARSRSHSGSPSQGGGSNTRLASRSPTRSVSPAGSDGRFRSRSRSISPDRM